MHSRQEKGRLPPLSIVNSQEESEVQVGSISLETCYHTIMHLLHVRIGAGELAENIADAAVADCLVFSLP